MTLSDDELKTQVAYGTLRATVRLAMRFKLPLKEMKRLVELAYYHQARLGKLKMKEIAEVMGVSMPKVGQLSRQYKDHFSKPETEQALPRRVLMLLWASPLSHAHLLGALSDFEPSEVEEALERLMAEGRVVKIPGRTPRYKVGGVQNRMVQDSWMARLDGLSNMMLSVAQTIEARFLDKDPQAFARTLRFFVNPEDIPRLQAFYEEELFALIVELNSAAEGKPEAVPLNMSMLWAPDDQTRTSDAPKSDKKKRGDKS